ncbi:MAG: phosphatidylserine/phosphatidylglycerophosphate/cardiolipin synthase family protein [Spirochaetia bacterium]|nr:phosphatidylserine/phosphatidylglycerophosphate/cardiolipin synthase family protein [Spirochaetia bacterium]
MKITLNKKYPARSHNLFSLFIDGNSYFPEILDSIKKAKWYIAIEMYLVEPGEMYDLLIEAILQKANTSVYIFLIFDHYGSIKVYQNEKFNLNHPYIYFKFYNKISISRFKNIIFRNHRKMILIDSNVVYTGGLGITDHFFSTSMSGRLWHEVIIKIKGECLKDWIDLFFKNFSRKNRKKNIIQTILSDERLNNSDSTQHLFQAGRLTYAKRFYYKDILRSTIKQINKSTKEIYIVTAYFFPAWSLRRALKKAANRGISVTILLPGKATDHPSVRQMGRRLYTSLLSSGIRIFEYQPVFNHSKIYVCDDWVSIGSCNLDRWSLQKNLEANQEVFDKNFAQTVIELILSDLKKSNEIKLSSWINRPLIYRIYEKFWSYVANTIEPFFANVKKRIHKK